MSDRRYSDLRLRGESCGLTFSLAFQEKAIELRYANSHQSHAHLTALVPMALGLLALTQGSIVLPLATGLLYLLSLWRPNPVLEHIAVLLTHISIRNRGFQYYDAVSFCGLAVIGMSYTGCMVNWRSQFVHFILHLIHFAWVQQDEYQTILYNAVLTLGLYFVEKNRRERWALREMARSKENQLLELVDSFDSGVLITDFSGNIIFQNERADVFLQTYAPSKNLNQELFQKLLHNALTNVPAVVRIKAPEGGDSLGARVTCTRFNWFLRSCALFCFTDISDSLALVSAFSKADVKMLHEASTMERDANRKYRETNDPGTLVELSHLHAILHSVNISLVYQHALFSKYASAHNMFNFRSELIDLIEVSNLQPELKGLTVNLSFESGVPTSVAGDKAAILCVFQHMYNRVTETCSQGSQVHIRVTVSGALQDLAKICCSFEFLSKDSSLFIEEMREVAQQLETQSDGLLANPMAVDLGAFTTLLQVARGVCSCALLQQREGKEQVLATYEYYMRPESVSRITRPMNSTIRQDLSQDKFKWDYRLEMREISEGQASENGVRRRYIKRSGAKHQSTDVSSVRSFLIHSMVSDPQILLTIPETNSTEQLSVEKVASDLMPNTSSDANLDEPGEAYPMEMTLLRRSAARHHCDLSLLNSSGTTSPSSSPIAGAYGHFLCFLSSNCAYFTHGYSKMGLLDDREPPLWEKMQPYSFVDKAQMKIFGTLKKRTVTTAPKYNFPIFQNHMLSQQGMAGAVKAVILGVIIYLPFFTVYYLNSRRHPYLREE